MSYQNVSDNIAWITREISVPSDSQRGRYNYGIVDEDIKYAVTEVVLYGDYDEGGVYWGGNGGIERIHCVHSVGSEEFCFFTRGLTPEESFDEAGIPVELRVQIGTKIRSFTCDSIGQADLSYIFQQFDDDVFYTGNFTGRNGTGEEAYENCIRVTKDWVFSPELYDAIRKWDRGLDPSEVYLRVVVLNKVATDYETLKQVYDDCTVDDDFSSPLDMLRYAEWGEDKECPIDCYPVDGSSKILFHFCESY